jgi:hypothetical protein
MAWSENLPFERGNTLFGIGAGGSITTVVEADLLAAYGGLLGREFKVQDPDYNGLEVTLMAVQYGGAANLTADARVVDFSDTLLTVFDDLAPPAGALGYPLDHKYEGKVIKAGDIVYVIKAGPCECEFAAAVTAGDNLATDTAGKLVVAQAGDQFQVGVAIDVGGTDTNATVLVGASRGIE